MGADGILSVTPYYNKPTQEGLYHHYKAIAAAISLPIILYNVQGRTNVNIDPATVRRLAEIENIIGVKEASGNISQIRDSAGAGGFPRALRRRCADAADRGDGRTRNYFRGLERNSGGNDAPGATCLAGDFAGARHAAQVHAAARSEFHRNESHAREGGHGGNGSARTRLASAAVSRRVRKISRRFAPCWNRSRSLKGSMLPQSKLRALFDEPARYTEEHHRLFRDFKEELNAATCARRSRTLSAHGLANQRLGKKRDSARLSHGAIVDMSVDPRSSRSSTRTLIRWHVPLADGVRIVPGGSSMRDGCYIGQRRRVHAADVRQRRRLRGRWHDGGFARAGGKLRAGGTQLPHLRGERKSAACSNRWAQCR